MKWNYSLIANSYLDFSILSSTFDSSADFKPKKKHRSIRFQFEKFRPKKTNSKREDDDQKFLITWNKTAKRQKIIGIERRPNQRVLLINQSIAHKKKKKRKLDYTSGRRNEKRLLWERERERERGWLLVKSFVWNGEDEMLDARAWMWDCPGGGVFIGVEREKNMSFQTWHKYPSFFVSPPSSLLSFSFLPF